MDALNVQVKPPRVMVSFFVMIASISRFPRQIAIPLVARTSQASAYPTASLIRSRIVWTRGSSVMTLISPVIASSLASWTAVETIVVPDNAVAVGLPAS